MAGSRSLDLGREPPITARARRESRRDQGRPAREQVMG